MASEADTAIVAVANLQRSIHVLKGRLDGIMSGLESLELQIRAFEHDREVLYENEATLHKVPVVSLRTYREIRAHLDETNDTLFGLIDKRASLHAERAATAKQIEKEKQELVEREDALEAIVEPTARIYYFPTHEH